MRSAGRAAKRKVRGKYTSFPLGGNKGLKFALDERPFALLLSAT